MSKRLSQNSSASPLHIPANRPSHLRHMELFVVSMLLLLETVLLLPITLHHRYTETWEPASGNTFSQAVRVAFTQPDSTTRRYIPTPTVSLLADYFTFGKEHPYFFRFHSLLALLAMTAFVCLLLRRLHVAGQWAFAFAFCIAVFPSSIYAVLEPSHRGELAIMLFFSMALYCISYCTSTHWLPAVITSSAAAILATGANPISALLIPLMPLVAWQCRDQAKPFPWLRLVLPEISLLAALGLFFVISVKIL